ncbi:MAG TPA: DCC1-like thiol-disulfide oxidoreductase family protein [Rhizomicrobium sp.]|nr:DCC1-like thiol-disulfide oxidoreductase family protein [Rhizomicrobium sp.]
MNPNRSGAGFWPDDGIILYDGHCVLCSGWTRFVLVRDKKRFFRFTPIQSDYGRALALALHIDPENPDTNAVPWRGVAYRRSDAALLVLSQLPGLGWVHILSLVPGPIRDLIYRIIARNRYAWFGQHAACDVGDLSYRDRVITSRT